MLGQAGGFICCQVRAPKHSRCSGKAGRQAGRRAGGQWQPFGLAGGAFRTRSRLRWPRPRRPTAPCSGTAGGPRHWAPTAAMPCGRSARECGRGGRGGRRHDWGAGPPCLSAAPCSAAQDRLPGQHPETAQGRGTCSGRRLLTWGAGPAVGPAPTPCPQWTSPPATPAGQCRPAPSAEAARHSRCG